jgi:hypothetical protein
MHFFLEIFCIMHFGQLSDAEACEDRTLRRVRSLAAGSQTLTDVTAVEKSNINYHASLHVLSFRVMWQTG